MSADCEKRAIRKRLLTVLLVIGLVAAPPNPPAHAFLGNLIAGIGDIVEGVFALPIHVLSGTMTGPPIIGTVGGVLTGAIHTVTSTTRGAFRLLGAAVPFAAKALPFLPFVL